MKLYLKTKDHSVSGEDFELRHDPDLDMLITYPQPEELVKYYESEAYISHTDANKSVVDKVYQAVKKYSIAKKIRLISSYANGKKKVLDFGAGTGDFLQEARKKGWTITGVEPNPGAREKSTAKGIHLYKNLSEIKSEKFQIITLWHVLEHLPNLEDQIKMLTEILEQEGTLIIAVPNFKSYDAKYYREHWAAYDVPRHVWHFSKTAIEKLFKPHGMRLVRTKPMVFDSFYVSLLSEKYKTGKQNYCRAFYRGLRSNMGAWSSKEYSSHIYLLQKV